jgi:sortase A
MSVEGNTGLRARPGAGKALHLLERGLIAGGVLLVLSYAAVTLWGQWSSARELGEFRRLLAVPDTALWSESRRAAYLDGLEHDPGAPIAVLTLDRLGIETPVFEGVSELNLNRGVARIEGTALVGESANVGVAGHRDSFFRALKDVAVGDVIRMEAPGLNKRYQVEELLIVEPEAVWVLDDTGRDLLTLVTCYPFYFVGNAPERFIVRARATP